MKFMGGVFIENDTVITTLDDPKHREYPISICFDGSAGLYIHLPYEQARDLHSRLGSSLRSVEHAGHPVAS